MNKVKLKIEGMNSEKNAKDMEKKLSDLKGVSVVKASHESGKVVVVFDEKEISEKEIDAQSKKIENNFDKELAKESKKIETDKYALFDRDVVFGLVSSVCLFSVIVNIFLLYVIFK